MEPRETVAFISGLLGILGWLEVRVRSLIKANQQVQDVKNDSLTSALSGSKNAVEKLTDEVVKLGKTLSNLQGRLSLSEENEK